MPELGHILQGQNEVVAVETLPTEVRSALKKLRIGSMRRDVYKYFRPDGGLNQAHYERTHGIASFSYSQERKWLMIYLVYRPHEMDAKTFSNFEQRVEWFSEHRPVADARDVLMGCSAPFLVDGLTVD